MTLTDDKIQEIIDSIDFSQMVTADDIFFMVARAIEKESQAKITDLENRLEAAQDELKVAAKLISDWVDHGQEMFNTIQALQSQSPAPVSETPAKTKLGKRLLELRQSAIDDGMELLTRDQILEPIASHAGEVGQALKQWNGLSADEVGKFVNDICEYGTDFVSPLFAVIENVEITLQRRNSAPHQPSKEQVREAFNKFEIEAVAYGASQNMSSKKMDAAKAELLALLQSQPKQSTGSEG